MRWDLLIIDDDRFLVKKSRLDDERRTLIPGQGLFRPKEISL
jgi:hypothetical protein